MPEASPVTGRQHVAAIPVLRSAKLALYQAMREHGLNHITLARQLGKLETEVRRMLDHATRIDRLEGALRVLGKQITTEVRRAA
jgi:antitoxin HicB